MLERIKRYWDKGIGKFVVALAIAYTISAALAYLISNLTVWVATERKWI